MVKIKRVKIFLWLIIRAHVRVLGVDFSCRVEPGCARLNFATWPGGENSTREYFLREKKDRRKFPDLR